MMEKEKQGKISRGTVKERGLDAEKTQSHKGHMRQKRKEARKRRKRGRRKRNK